MKNHTNLLELNRQVIQGTSNGKIIWQPRIICWFEDKEFLGEALPPPLAGLNRVQSYRALGCSNRIYDYNACFYPVYPDSVRNSQIELDNGEIESVTETPVGRLTTRMRGNTSNPGWFYSKWPVETEDDLRIALWLAERTGWRWNQQAYDSLWETWGDIGLPVMFMPRTTVQDLYLNTMGVEGGIYAITDYPDTVESYFAALSGSHMRLIDVINASPIEWINFGDNLHGGTLSPKLFEKHVLPAYLERCDKLHSAGKFVFSHWDGDVKPLLPYAKVCGLDGIEAITPKPQGDVTPEEMKAALGDEVFLVDGIAAVLFEETFPVEQLVEQTNKIIELFAPKLILGISDEMPSRGCIDRVRLVGEIVDSYNSRQ